MILGIKCAVYVEWDFSIAADLILMIFKIDRYHKKIEKIIWALIFKLKFHLGFKELTLNWKTILLYYFRRNRTVEHRNEYLKLLIFVSKFMDSMSIV